MDQDVDIQFQNKAATSIKNKWARASVGGSTVPEKKESDAWTASTTISVSNPSSSSGLTGSSSSWKPARSPSAKQLLRSASSGPDLTRKDRAHSVGSETDESSSGEPKENTGATEFVILKISVPALNAVKTKKIAKQMKIKEVVQRLNTLLPPQTKSDMYFLFYNGNRLDPEKTLEDYNIQHVESVELKREAKYEFAFKNSQQQGKKGNLFIDEEGAKTSAVIKQIGEWANSSSKQATEYKLLRLIRGASLLRQEFGDLKDFSQYYVKTKDELELEIYFQNEKQLVELVVEYSPIVKLDPIKNADSTLSTKSGAKPFDKLKNLIRGDSPDYSAPYNVQHRQHVDFHFTWVGQNPEDIFEIGEQLGIGAYATVFLATHRETKFVLAVKKVKLNPNGKNNALKGEIEVLKKCKSPNIVSYYGTVALSNEVWILMDYCAGGSVKDILNLTLEPLEEYQIAEVTLHTLKGLAYLHTLNIIHLDVKAGNIMLTEDAQVKIGDFGVSEQLQQEAEGTQFNTLVGSPLFMAPEVIKKEKATFKADIWSLGITLIEMTEGRPPNTDICSVEMLRDLPNRPPPVLQRPDLVSKNFNAFIARCLVKDPKSRPSAIDLLTDSFVQNTRGPSSLLPMIRNYLALRKENHQET